MSLNYKIIGRRVKEVRRQNHLSQAEFAERIDMSATYISHIERATKRASLESLVRIANVLGVTVDTLLSGNQANDPMKYNFEFVNLLNDCDSYEKRVLYEITVALKNSLRDSYCLQHKRGT